MDKELALRKGQKASQILNDPIVKEAFENVRSNIYRQIESSTFAQTHEREDAYRMLRALTALEGEIDKFIRKAKGIRAEESEAGRVVRNLSEVKE